MQVKCRLGDDRLFHLKEEQAEITIGKNLLKDAQTDCTVNVDFILDTGSQDSLLSRIRAAKCNVDMDNLTEGRGLRSNMFGKAPTKKLPSKLTIKSDNGEEKIFDVEFSVPYKGNATFLQENLLGLDFILFCKSLTISDSQACLDV